MKHQGTAGLREPLQSAAAGAGAAAGAASLHFDAVVVGAGVAGSSAAILLARAGWSVALVEKRRFPRRKVCGECLAASNLPLLEALGVGPAFDGLAGPALRRMALMRGDEVIEAALPAAPLAAARWGRALGRETLDSLLLAQARAAGAAVYMPWSLQAIEGSPGAWRCTLRSVDTGGTTVLRAPVTIAAQGSWEPLPSARAAQRRPRRPSDLFAFKANFTGSSLREGLLPVLAFDGGYGGMVVADDAVTTVACCIRADRLDAVRRQTALANVRVTAGTPARAGDAVEALLRRECRGVREALAGATRQGAWLSAGPLDPGIRLHDDGGPFRIGNAAGEAHPIIGEGMSMAMQSAWLLCGLLAANGRGDNIADAAWQRDLGRLYASQWRRQFAPRLRLAAAFAHTAMRPPTASALMTIAKRWPGLLTRGATWAAKTRCAVDPDRLAAAAWPLGGAAASLAP